MYGDGRHNALFRDRFGLNRLFLHCASLELGHPATDRELHFTAPLPAELKLVLDGMGYGCGGNGHG
jgi:tRNA pseudouridine65 synthase